MKCIKCDYEATYDSPEPLCNHHWALWFTHNQPDDEHKLTPEQEQEFYRDVMLYIEEKYGKQSKTS